MNYLLQYYRTSPRRNSLAEWSKTAPGLHHSFRSSKMTNINKSPVLRSYLIYFAHTPQWSTFLTIWSIRSHLIFTLLHGANVWSRQFSGHLHTATFIMICSHSTNLIPITPQSYTKFHNVTVHIAPQFHNSIIHHPIIPSSHRPTGYRLKCSSKYFDKYFINLAYGIIL